MPQLTTIITAATALAALTGGALAARWALQRRRRRQRDTQAVRWTTRIHNVHLDDITSNGNQLRIVAHGDGTWRWDGKGRRQYFDTPARRNTWRWDSDDQQVDAHTTLPETMTVTLPGGSGAAVRALEQIADRVAPIHLRIEGRGSEPGRNITRYAISDDHRVLLRYSDGQLTRPSEHTTTPTALTNGTAPARPAATDPGPKPRTAAPATTDHSATAGNSASS